MKTVSSEQRNTINIAMSLPLIPALILLCVGSQVSANIIETFKIPADQNVLEIIRDSEQQIHFGIRNIPEDKIKQYTLRLDYGSHEVSAGGTSNYDYLFTVDADECASKEEGKSCKELEVTVRGHSDINGKNISMVLYEANPFPSKVTEAPVQKFTIRVIDPPTPPPPTTTPPPVECTMAPAANAVGAPAKTTGHALLGVFLGAAFLASFVGNFIFIILWHRARSSSTQPRSSKTQRPTDVELGESSVRSSNSYSHPSVLLTPQETSEELTGN